MLIFLASVMKLDDRAKYSLMNETDFHNTFNSLLNSIISKDAKTAQASSNNLLNALNSYKNAAKYNKTEIEKASAGLKSILGSIESGDFAAAKTTANGLTVYGHINGIFGKEAPALTKLQQPKPKQQPNAFAQIDKLMNSADEKSYHNYKGAIEDFTNAIKLLEKLPESKEKTEKLSIAYFKRGYVQYEVKKYKDAIADFNKSIRVAPNMPCHMNTYLFRGYAQYGLKSYKDAIADFNRAMKMASGSAVSVVTMFSACAGRADSKCALGDFKGAIADYTQASKLIPDDPGVYISRGNAQYSLKKYKDAVADYNRAIKVNSQYPHANTYLMRSKCYAKLGMKKEADADLKEYEKRIKQE